MGSDSGSGSGLSSKFRGNTGREDGVELKALVNWLRKLLRRFGVTRMAINFSNPLFSPLFSSVFPCFSPSVFFSQSFLSSEFWEACGVLQLDNRLYRQRKKVFFFLTKKN